MSKSARGGISSGSGGEKSLATQLARNELARKVICLVVRRRGWFEMGGATTPSCVEASAVMGVAVLSG